jgi:hypothetical protein
MASDGCSHEAIPVMGFAAPVFAAGRNTSVRNGTRWLGVAQVRLLLGDGRLSPPLDLHTRALRFDQLTASDLACEHDPACRDPAGLLAVLQQHYPGFQAGAMVTVCDFWLPAPPVS